MKKILRRVLGLPQKQRKIIWVSYSLVVVLLSLTPGRAVTHWSWLSQIHMDKWIHAAMYALWVWIACTVFPTRKARWWLVLMAVLLGVLLEIIQGAFIPMRHMDYVDALFNTVGALIGAGTFYLLSDQASAK